VALLPSGRQHFLYSVQWTVPGEGAETGLYAGSLVSDREKLVSSEISGNVAFASGRLLFACGGTIMAAPFEPDRVNLTGSPISITDQEIETEAIFLQTGFSVASKGALMFESTDDFASHLAWFDSSGRELGRIPQSGYRSPSLSPNGRMVAVACDEAHSGSNSICIYDLDRGVSTPLPTDPATPIQSGPATVERSPTNRASRESPTCSASRFTGPLHRAS
jgi:hypothetical protein